MSSVEMHLSIAVPTAEQIAALGPEGAIVALADAIRPIIARFASYYADALGMDPASVFSETATLVSEAANVVLLELLGKEDG